MNDPGRLLIELLEAYSPSGAEANGVAAFRRVAEELGYATRVDAAGNGIATRGTGRPQIVYLGHIDTVEGRLPVRRDGERVVGRGACDAKGPLLSALLGGAEAAAAGEITVVAAVGEETDSRGARALIPALRPDFVIAGEPSGWAGLALGYKGNLRLRLRFRGSRQHLSSPQPSTTERAIAWVAAARPPAEATAGPFHSLTAKVASVRTEDAGGVESVEVVIDFRLPPGSSIAAIRAALPPWDAGDSMETIAEVEPYLSDRNDPVVRALTEGIRSQGGQPTYFKKGGTSDLNLVAPAWGTGGAAYGPGDSHLDHTDRESLDLEELARAAQALRVAFERLGARAPPLTPRRAGPDAG